MPQLTDHGPHWAKSWASFGDIERLGPEAAGEFTHLHDDTGGSALSVYNLLKLSFVRRPELDLDRPVDAIAVSLVVDGSMAIEVGGRVLNCQAGDGFLLDSGRDFRFVHDSLTTTCICTYWLPRLRLPVAAADLVQGLMLSATSLPSAVLLSSLRVLAGRIDKMMPNELQDLTPGLAAMVTAAAQREAGPQIKWGRETRTSRVLKFIESNLTSSELEPDRIAGQFGLSRASLYRLFEPLGGVASYIRVRRLERARAELTAKGSSSRSIALVGRKFGYPDAASFSRAFRAQFGLSPMQMVKAQAAPAAALPAASMPAWPKTRTLADFLSDLSARRR